MDACSILLAHSGAQSQYSDYIIHTHCFHLSLDLRLQSKWICICQGRRVYNSITSLHPTSTRAQRSFFGRHSHPLPTVFVCISPRHHDPTSFTSSSAEICQLKTSHATTLRARPKPHRRMTCYFWLKASCFQQERLEGHAIRYSFWQLDSFAISWNFSTTGFMEKQCFMHRRYAHPTRIRSS